jgi:hypothetical protein
MLRRPEYQREPEELRDQIWSAGAIAPLQLFRIVAWKSAKGLAPLSLNSEEQIHTISASAISSIESWRRIDVLTDDVDWSQWRTDVSTSIGRAKTSGLLALHGVGYPVATAILSLLAPSAFPVIDRWTIGALYESMPRNWRSSEFYRHFTQRLTEVAHHYPDCQSVHRVDQAVMNHAMSTQELPFHRVLPPSS